MRLVHIQPILQNILNMLSTSLNVEGSIIDNEYNLLAYTDNYLKFKGAEVHSPFIKQVMEVGEIIVSHPGFMPVCTGCRFQEKCPAKIEILHAIRFEDRPIGTISISSFNNAEDCLIDKDIKTYRKAVLDTALLIESVLHNQLNGTRADLYKEMLRFVIDTSPEGMLCVNSSGTVLFYNRSAAHLFGDEDLHDLRINALLPENRLSKVLSPDFTGRVQTRIRNRRIDLSSRPILWDGMFHGAVIRLTPESDDRHRQAAGYTVDFNLDRMLGESVAIQILKEQILRAAPTDSAVLITGETGTGKELVARGIHTASSRSDQPFVAVNCAAIPEHLLESEFFGYDEGAFTGAARKGKMGLIELANGGTLFLDEIGDMPLSMQSKLLRVLQDGELRRVGGERSTRIDLRIVSATNQDLREQMKSGTFRSDLYYRLDVIRLNTPPLRERIEDIPLLARTFMEAFCHRFSRTIDGFEPDAQELLRQYAWPGNVRELQNVMEYAVNMETGSRIRRSTLLNKIAPPGTDSTLALKDQIDAFERKLILEALARYGSDRTGKERVAEELDIGLRTLYRKLETLQIQT